MMYGRVLVVVFIGAAEAAPNLLNRLIRPVEDFPFPHGPALAESFADPFLDTSRLMATPLTQRTAIGIAETVRRSVLDLIRPQPPPIVLQNAPSSARRIFFSPHAQRCAPQDAACKL